MNQFLTNLYVKTITTLPLLNTNQTVGITLKEGINGNDIIRYIVSALGGLIILYGVISGLWTVAKSRFSQGSGEENGGWLQLIICLAIGGIMIAVVNLVLA